jgi:signal transduction histidine kinase
MADALLTLARIDAGQFRLSIGPVRLDEILVDSVQSLRGPAGLKKISIDLHVASAVEMNGDAERLKSVVLNLLDNAIKFSPEGGAVDCSLSSDGDTAALSVTDRGPGIPDAEIGTIFKRFYQSEQARAKGNGSGLGLAIVEHIVRLHGGSVEASSDAGTGSTFTVRIPIRSGPG